jgi:hypothetical protein
MQKWKWCVTGDMHTSKEEPEQEEMLIAGVITVWKEESGMKACGMLNRK